MPNATRKHATRRTPEYIPRNWIFNGNKYVSELDSYLPQKYEDNAYSIIHLSFVASISY